MGKGKILIACFFGAVILMISGAAAWAAVGYDEDPDLSGGVDGPSWGATTIGDELWIGGEFTTARNAAGNSVARQRVAVFNINTGELTDTVVNVNDDVRALESDEDTVWIGGYFATVDGARREAVARWDPLGETLLTEFDASINGDVLALKLHRDWLYIGGDFTIGNRRNLVRVNPTTGAIDNGFAPDPNSRVADIDAHGDAIYIAGSFTRIGPGNNRENEFAAASIDWQTGRERGVDCCCCYRWCYSQNARCCVPCSLCSFRAYAASSQRTEGPRLLGRSSGVLVPNL